MPEKVYALMLYRQWDHNPSSVHCVMSSYDLAKEALLSLDANAKFVSETHGTCYILDGWSGLDRWMIIECVIDLNPEDEAHGNTLFQPCEPEKEATIIPPPPVASMERELA